VKIQVPFGTLRIEREVRECERLKSNPARDYMFIENILVLLVRPEYGSYFFTLLVFSINIQTRWVWEKCRC
jgi:hypothetical protein